jgi:hypothetical protein
MLSQKARYALHSLIVLAERGGDEPMMIADIAEEANVPRKFLEQILLSLKRRGIVRSHRGRQGGPGAEPLRQRHRIPQMRRLRGRRNLRHPQGAFGGPRRDRRRARIPHPGLRPNPRAAQSARELTRARPPKSGQAPDRNIPFYLY